MLYFTCSAYNVAGCRDTNRLFWRWCVLSGFPDSEPYDEVPDKRFCRQVYERRMKKSFGPRILFVVRLARRQQSKSRPGLIYDWLKFLLPRYRREGAYQDSVDLFR